jgi:hypothetical protein
MVATSALTSDDSLRDDCEGLGSYLLVVGSTIPARVSFSLSVGGHGRREKAC